MKTVKLSYEHALTCRAEKRLAKYLQKLGNRRFRRKANLAIKLGKDIVPVCIKGLYD